MGFNLPYSRASKKITKQRRWNPKPEVPSSKPLGCFEVDSAFHSSEVDQMSTRNFCGLLDKKQTNSSRWLCILEAVEPHP